MVAFCFGFGAVTKVPTSLRLPRLADEAEPVLRVARRRLTRFCTVLSWPFFAATDVRHLGP